MDCQKCKKEAKGLYPSYGNICQDCKSKLWCDFCDRQIEGGLQTQPCPECKTLTYFEQRLIVSLNNIEFWLGELSGKS